MIQLTSTNAGLTNTVTVADPFVNKIHYTATASYNGTSETINTTTAIAGTPTAGQHHDIRTSDEPDSSWQSTSRPRRPGSIWQTAPSTIRLS